MKIQYSMSFAMSKDGFPAFNAIRETEISCPFCRRHVRLALPDLGFEYDRPEADAAYKMMDEMDALLDRQLEAARRARAAAVAAL